MAPDRRTRRARRYTSHSARVGFCVTATEAGVPAPTHRSRRPPRGLAMTRRYATGRMLPVPPMRERVLASERARVRAIGGHRSPEKSGIRSREKCAQTAKRKCQDRVLVDPCYPDAFVRIGISRGPPRGQRGYRMYSPLKPGRGSEPCRQSSSTNVHGRSLPTSTRGCAVGHQCACAGKTPALLCCERPPRSPLVHRGWSLAAQRHLDLDVLDYGHEAKGARVEPSDLPLVPRR